MKNTYIVNKIQWAFLSFSMLFVFACNKGVEPIKLETPERSINTGSLETFKSNLAERKISVGYIANWGINDASILFHTPDSLDLIVLMDNYTDLSDPQQKDLQEVRSKKATKVLISHPFTGKFDDLPKLQERTSLALVKLDSITNSILDRDSTLQYGTVRDSVRKFIEQEVIKTTKVEIVTKIMEKLGSIADAIALIDRYNYDGLSLSLPQLPVETYYQDTLKQVLNNNITVNMGIGTNKILLIENPQPIFSGLIEKANWLVYKKSTPSYYLSYFTDEARKFPNKKFLPSADFGNETDKDGFMDSETFGADGILPRTLDILNWKNDQLGGVAYYNIQRNYLDISGNITYARLKKIIHQLQGN